VYDFQLLTISATQFPVWSCSFECHLLSFQQVAQQAHCFLTSRLSLILPSIISCSTCPNHTCWRFLTLSNTALVSFTLCRTSSLFILFTQLIFSILLEVQIYISMASNLFLSAWIIDRVSDAYNTTMFNTLFAILFTTLYSNCPWTVSFINKCLFTQCNPMTCLSPTVPICRNNTS